MAGKKQAEEQREARLHSLKYGEAKERLEKILDELESSEVDVDQLADRVKEAAGLIRVLHEKLTRTQGEVERIMEEVRQAAPDNEAEESIGETPS